MFNEKLKQAWNKNQSLLCLGLDPDLTKIPKHLLNEKNPIFEFNKIIIENTFENVCCYKPQIAYYSGQGAEDQLIQTIQFIKKHCPNIPIILDSKRGDIGPTAEMYAKESFQHYQADAVTVNPYMGTDTISAFTDYKEKGVIILCKTSNPGSMDFQNLEHDGKKLFEWVAIKASSEWNQYQNVQLVVGATYPKELKKIRHLVDQMPLLIPGIGAQGGDLKEVLVNGLDKNKSGVMINVSRSIIYSDSGTLFFSKVKQEALNLKNQINDIRNSL